MNPNDTPQRIRWGLIVTLIIVAVLFMIADSTGNLSGLLSLVRDPVAVLMQWSADRTNSFANLFAGPRDLQEARQYIQELESQVATLQRQNEELRAIQGEYQTLQEMFEHANETPELNRILSQVIGYNTNSYFQSIIIDKGAADGVVVGMPVESARGLVGQVFRTSEHAAQVLLVTDNSSSIPARLGESRATGLLRGGGLGGSMTLNWVELEVVINIGDVVVSSGLAGRFPADLVIGRVIDVQRSQANLYQQALVQPVVDFDSLEEVFVITGVRPIDTGVFDTPDS